MKYDVLIISFSKPMTDARTINLVSTLLRNGKSVCLIALKDELELEGLEFIPIDIDSKQRMIKRWFSFYWQVKKWKHKISADIVIAEDLYSLPIMNNIFSQRAEKLIYDSREIYSALGPLESSKLKQQIITSIEKKHIYKVDEIVVSGQQDAVYIKDYYNLEVPFRLIMNLPPYKEIVRSDKLKEHLNITDDIKILIYQGEILNGRGLIASVDALEYLEKFALVIFGDGPYLNDLKQYTVKKNLANRVHFIGKVPYAELHWWTCSADVGLSLFKPISKSYELALPNKLFEYCMAGIPTIASDLAPIENVVDRDEVGILILKNDITGSRIAEAVKSLYFNNRYETITSNCIAASKRYSYESQEDMILEMCK